MDELPIRSGDDVVRVRQQVRTVAAENGLSLKGVRTALNAEKGLDILNGKT